MSQLDTVRALIKKVSKEKTRNIEQAKQDLEAAKNIIRAYWKLNPDSDFGISAGIVINWEEQDIKDIERRERA